MSERRSTKGIQSGAPSSLTAELGSIVRADPKYKQFKAIVVEARKRLRLEKDMEEACMMHDTRKTTTIIGNPERYSHKFLMDCVMVDMSYRNRLVKLRREVLKQTTLLDQATRTFQDYAATQYIEKFKGYGTAEQRRRLLDRMVTPALDTLADTDAHLSILAEFIQDIDQANFQMQRIVALLQLHVESRGMKNV